MYPIYIKKKVFQELKDFLPIKTIKPIHFAWKLFSEAEEELGLPFCKILSAEAKSPDILDVGIAKLLQK